MATMANGSQDQMIKLFSRLLARAPAFSFVLLAGVQISAAAPSDQAAANRLGLSLQQLQQLHARFSLSNDELLALPDLRLRTLVWDADHPNFDKHAEEQKFRALRMMDEHGRIPPDGLLRAIQQHRRNQHQNNGHHEHEHDEDHGHHNPHKPPEDNGGDEEGDLFPVQPDPSPEEPSFGEPGSRSAGIQSATWTWVGPGNIGGRVRAILPHPTQTNILYCGGVDGGIWKTTNSGASWFPLNDFMANLAIASLAMDPADSNIIYAGTGEGTYNIDAIRGAGIFKSVDGGATWFQLSGTTGSSFQYVSRLAIDPNNSQILLAATRSGIQRSINGGTNWTSRLATEVLCIAYHPTDSLQAIASGYNGHTYYSTDGGLSWTAATGLPSPSGFVVGRVELAYSRSAPTNIYASIDVTNGQVYASVDAGHTYTLRNTGNSFLGSQGWYDNFIWADPVNVSNVIVGGLNVWRSIDGGVTFTDIGGYSGSIHPDQHTLVAHPQFNGTTIKTIYVGNDGGIFRATDAYTASSSSGWTKLNNNLGITQFYGGAGNPSTGVLVGGTQDNGSLRYTTAGGSNGWTSMFGGDGGFSAADPTNSSYFYGEYVYLQIHRSANGGSSSSYIYSGITNAGSSSGANFIAPYILDPNNPNTMLAGGISLWRSINVKAGTPTWAVIKTSIGSAISAIAVAPGKSDVIWVGHNSGEVYYTTNGTATNPTWYQRDLGTPNLPNRSCERIAVTPGDSKRVYVTFGGFNSGNVWRTSDNGVTWANISANLPAAPINSIVIASGDTNTLYVGTEVGIYGSTNNGGSWATGNDGPANVAVDELFWLSNKLVAVTHGRGMYYTAPVLAGFNGSPTTGVRPLTVTFTNLSIGATNYAWDFGDGQTSAATNASNIYTNAGTYTVSLTAIGALTSTVIRTNYIVVTNPAPVVPNFTGSPTNGYAPLAVNFSNLSTGATNYFWDFGDGQTSTATNPSHAYTNVGTFSVTLTAVGLAGTNSLTRANYIVASNLPPPVVGFAGTPTNGAAPLAVSFTNLTLYATNYSWDFGDGSFSVATNLTKTYTNAGAYTVTLTAIGPSGTNSITAPGYVVVTNAPAVIVAQPQSLSVLVGSNATFSIVATGSPPLIYQWLQNGTNIPGATAASYTRTNIQIADRGAYSALVTNVAGSASSSNATLDVILIPGVITILGDPYMQNFDSLTSTGTTAPFGWYVGTGTADVSGKALTVGAGASSFVRNYNFGSTGDPDRALGSLAGSGLQRNTEARFVNASASYILSLGISYNGEQWHSGNENGVTNDLVMQYSTDGTNFVNLGPAFNFSSPQVNVPANALNGNDSSNRVTGTGGTYTPAASISNGQFFVLRWADADDTDNDHGLALDNLVITFNLGNPVPPVVPDFAAAPTNGLAPLLVNFTNLTTGATNYFWDFGDGNTSASQNPINTFSNAGTYTVALTAIGAAGTSSLTRTNFITLTNAPPPPVVTDFAAAPTNGLAPLLVNLTNLTTGATNYFWAFGDGNTSANQNPSNTYSNAGSYTVSLVAVGAAGTNSLIRTNFITVTNAPAPPVLPDFVAAPTNGVAPLLVNFTNLTTGATNYYWDFGDGNASTSQDPANMYTNAGNYSVSVVAVGAGGTNSLTRTNYILVILAPRLVVTPGVLDFGLIHTDATAQAALTISNAGGATLNGSASISSPVFGIASGTPFSLESAAWTNLVVIFTPAGAGAFTNEVVFTSNGGASTNVLIGRAIDPPLILSTAFSGSDFSFSFASLSGFTYVVQYKDALVDSGWQPLNSIAGDGTVKTVSLPTASSPQRFYRLSVE